MKKHILYHITGKEPPFAFTVCMMTKTNRKKADIKTERVRNDRRMCRQRVRRERERNRTHRHIDIKAGVEETGHEK
jgi:hypothetical protein